MSLHTLANHLQSAGRGEDKVLVHMTPKEVGGLQSLAMAHGGSLTINPETGLPEAGFLSSILPMIAGFALGPAGMGITIGGLSSAASAGLVSGALSTVMSGSLKQGLMAGLGAYGGAGLGQGLMAQGAQGAAGAAGVADDVALANMQRGNLFGNAAPQPAGVFGQPAVNASNMALPAYTPPTPPPPVTTPVTNASAYSPTDTGTPAYAQTPYVTQTGEGYRVMNLTDTPVREAYSSLNPPPMPKMPPGATGYVFDPVKGGYNYYGPSGNPVMAPSAASGYVPGTATTSRPFAGGIQGQYTGPSGAMQTPPSAFSERMSQLGQGVKTSFSSTEGLKGLYNAMPQGSVIASGLTLAEAMKPKPLEEKKDKSLIRPYDFEYNPTNIASEPYSGSAERLYFNPTFTARTPYEAPGPEYAAAGGLMGYAVGGQVEQMSAMNSVGANTGYPMASIDTPMYANPMRQRPEATNVLAPSADAGVGTYTGEARFAVGGPTTKQGSGSLSMFGRGRISKEPESSGYEYSYDPKTMQFTQLSAPTIRQPVIHAMTGARTGAFTTSDTPVKNSDSKISGGIKKPIMQPQSPAQPLIPNINIPAYQTPEQQLGLGGFYDYMNQQMSGMRGYAAGGGISHLGGYSDGGRLLKGPGDGVSDSIPASIGNRQPARLADGEFVVPARIVSEIGNGSTEAGARKLYAMMDRVQRARRKTTGKGQVARNTKAEKLLPA
jgi:hypothetical protein